jgi:hypothetical protein
MKVISIIFVASVGSTLAAERGLQSLARKWNITDPSFTYDSLGVDLDYPVSDFIDNAHTLHALWTSPGCQATGNPVPASVLTSTRPVLTGQAYNPTNNGDGVRDQKLTFGVVAATIADSDIYVEDTTVGSVTATIDFCVRFSLLTAGAVEVSFIETLVTFFVDRSDGFAIGDVSVTPKQKIKNTANQVYLLDGYQCNASNDALTGSDLTDTKIQGSVIRVCVKPDAEAVAAGIKMRSLDDFTFSRDDISQEAIVGYNQEANNGLTILFCSNGVDVCVFESILFADFYSTPGVVLGSGTGSMQFGPSTPRRLSTLQADMSESTATSEFEIDFGVNERLPIYYDIDPNDIDPNFKEEDSGAATPGAMAATALVVAGAFALI